jgi:SAM-dependent methyltransferase
MRYTAPVPSARPAELPHGLSGRDEACGYFDWIAGLFGDALSGGVLDHGAGTGMLTERLAARASRVFALEPEPVLFDGLKARFATRPNVTLVQGDMDVYLAQYGARSLDAVVSSNVLEHLEDDVDCMRQIHRALRPGGAFAVYVPARAELFGSLDESVGHVRRYSRSLLRARLDQAGFFVQWIRYGNLAGVVPWWVSGRLLKRRRIPGQNLKLFDRFVLPVAARVEKLLPIPYGLNVAALARRQ